MATKQDEKQMQQPKPTPESVPDSELSEIELLRRQVAQQNELIQRLTEQNQAQAAAAPGFGAYLIYSPVPTYSGKTAGVQFRNGLAMLPMVEGSAEKAQVLRDEFHYRVVETDDWRTSPVAGELTNRLADML
jgi:hypothetical protein